MLRYYSSDYINNVVVIIIQQSYFAVDVGVHPLLEERGDLADISITEISKHDLLEYPLIVSLKLQRNKKQVVREEHQHTYHVVE